MAEITADDMHAIAKAAVKETLLQTTRLSREDATNIASAAAISAVNEAHVRMFSHLGYDMANRDDIKRFRSNLDFTERMRIRTDSISKAVSNSIATAIVLAILGLVVLGARLSLGSGPPGK